MIDRKAFSQKISHLKLTRAEQAIALLWYYRFTQAYEERTASELADDLSDDGLGRPNVTTLHKDLTKSRRTVKGKRSKTFQIHVKYLQDLNTKYEDLLNVKTVHVTAGVIPEKLFQGTKPHLERMVYQINGCYEYTFYDGCAVLIRRLLESLIIEAFIHKKKVADIRPRTAFLMLDGLITKITNHPDFILGRNTPKTMNDIKKLGDTAAHDRMYITQVEDINDLKTDIRRTMQEMLTHAGLAK